MSRQISNKAEFEQLMSEVDAAMQARNLPIVGRGIAAYQEVARRLQRNVFLTPKGTPAIPDNYTGLSLSAHIDQWTENRYGARLAMDLALGYSVVMIRGDAWLIRIPIVLGGALAVVEPDLSKQFPEFVVNKPGQPEQRLIINILQAIKSLPQGLASSLNDEECRSLLKYFISAHECLRVIDCLFHDNDLATAACRDLTTSARHTVAGDAELGLARWASLQAAEKFLKFYLPLSGMSSPPFTHKLKTLFELAEARGLPAPRPGIVDLIQCDASIRYEQRPLNIVDVVNAHQAAMEIGCIVTKTLMPDPPY